MKRSTSVLAVVVLAILAAGVVALASAEAPARAETPVVESSCGSVAIPEGSVVERSADGLLITLPPGYAISHASGTPEFLPVTDAVFVAETESVAMAAFSCDCNNPTTSDCWEMYNPDINRGYCEPYPDCTGGCNMDITPAGD